MAAQTLTEQLSARIAKDHPHLGEYVGNFFKYNPKIQPFRFVGEFDSKITGDSIKFKFSKRRVFGETGSINEGLSKQYTIKPGYDDPVELIKVYNIVYHPQ